MKRYLIYFLLVTYLFSFSEVRQMMKLPKLIEHYISHELKDSNTTLFSFFKMHYLDETVKDADYEQDMKLPFKCNHHSSISIHSTAPPKLFEISFENHNIFKEVKQNFSYSENVTISKFTNIFHPPKVV